MKSSITQLNLIEPKKCIIEDLEILAFENEEELKYYTLWHEALVNKKKGLTNEADSIQANVVPTTSSASKKLLSSHVSSLPNATTTTTSTKTKLHSSKKVSISRVSSLATLASNFQADDLNQSKSFIQQLQQQQQLEESQSFAHPTISIKNQPPPLSASQTANANSHILQGSASLPNGLTILNSARYNTLPSNKQMMKYKLTKLYNKYRGRQMRRNFVIEKQRNAKIEAEISKSYLNSWLTYTALQALRLPDNNRNQLTAATTNNGKILTTMAQPTSVFTTTAPATPFVQAVGSPYTQPFPMMPMINGTTQNGIKKIKSPSKKVKSINSTQQQQQQQHALNQKPPMHLVYIDPGNIITYSNRINPQQIIEYKKKPPIQPSSATSKKSSAASYDVYEIMEVLANTNKTNVTITRNANRPSNQTSGSNASSIYSHSVNANTPGIVSTQLHLQARSYLDLMSKFYAEEAERLQKEKEEMMNEPSVEEVVGRYLKI